MDPRTAVHQLAKDESSEDENRLSTDAPSYDDDVDSEKGGANSKKRRRGSYRCSRCGMPKRGHNCPDTFETVHFAIVDSPSHSSSSLGKQAPTTAASSVATGPGGGSKSGSSISPHGLPSLDDCPKETLLLHLNKLRDENMRLIHENQHLHEVCQYQAHSLRHLQSIPHGPLEFPHNGQGQMLHGSNPQGMFAPANAAPMPQHTNGFSFAPSGAAGPSSLVAQSVPNPISAPQLPRPNFVSAPSASLPHSHPAPSLPINTSLPVNGHPMHIRDNKRGTNSLPAFSVEDDAPSAKRSKLEESTASGPYNHPNTAAPSLPYPSYLPFQGSSFPAEQFPELNRAPPSRFIVAGGPSQYEYDYDSNEWQDNDSSTSSEFYPSFQMDPAPTLIY